MKTLLMLMVAAGAIATLLTGCPSAADVASENLSKAADNFDIPRRVVFYNSRTDSFILEVDGLCSLGNADKSGELTVTCKTGPGQYKKHFLGLARDVTYFAEQLESADVSTAHYKVIFKPSVIVPDIEVK